MSKNKGKYFLFGSIIGFLLGLFLAPKKGSELRKETKEKMDEIKENPREVLDGTIETVKNKISNIVEDCDIDDVKIVEDEIIISKTFEDEGDNI
ncbi:Gas vesicle protein [[Clostridium] sordellii]|uniref:YtxH domain-containing protein n=1 Tax=Paraclostridium sordellii TaxID=1505 RepID=UPI0005EA1D4F|nr:YtxH domain-containing protein [Paeniclostridium sordellii]CEP98412.1 Gas vesicle protein [[Clostridium] sordellii] [Paeniclostridium sordellii]